MDIHVTPNLIHNISENWEDPRKGEETHEMIEAIVAELKKDYRDYQRRHYNMSDDDAAHWEGLISDVTNRDFWDKIDHLLQFRFEY